MSTIQYMLCSMTKVVRGEESEREVEIERRGGERWAREKERETDRYRERGREREGGGGAAAGHRTCDIMGLANVFCSLGCSWRRGKHGMTIVNIFKFDNSK